MELSILIKGIFIGFIILVPIGPIGILCIRQTLTKGQMHGLIIGFGGATADFIYACLAAFGLSLVTSIINSQMMWIRLTGGVFLLFLGIKIFRTRPTNFKTRTTINGMLKSYISIVLLTLTNPLTIFAYIGAFALFGLKEKLEFSSTIFLVSGVFLGSFLWFVFLSSFTAFFRNKFSLEGLQKVNKIVGVSILISFVFVIISLL